MIRAAFAIARLRRDLALSTALKAILLGAALLAVFFDSFMRAQGEGSSLGLLVIGGIWLVLVYQSVKGSQLAAMSPSLIAAGDFEQAELALDRAIRSFSLSRAVKLRTVHYLALLRHAQQHWGETAELCQALLSERLAALPAVGRSARLLLADAMLESGNLPGAQMAMAGLANQTLTLNETLDFTMIRLDYLSRIEAWSEMMGQVRQSVELAELMPSQRAARIHALLALASRKTGRGEWESWLRRRAELLTDPAELRAWRGTLGELWFA